MNIARVIRTLTAHGYGQTVTILSTIAIPAVVISKWGADGFGYWVTLSAISLMFHRSDLGASVGLSNQLGLKSGRTCNDAWLLVRATIRNFLKLAILKNGYSSKNRDDYLVRFEDLSTNPATGLWDISN